MSDPLESRAPTVPLLPCVAMPGWPRREADTPKGNLDPPGRAVNAEVHSHDVAVFPPVTAATGFAKASGRTAPARACESDPHRVGR
jgi:hypothetical protein